jgi:membrane associated rhomboid family serine protease
MSYFNNNTSVSVPTVTRNLLIINVIVWLACFGLARMNLVNFLGLHYFQSKGFYVFQFITHIFTHEDFSHLFFNMFALFLFGTVLENVWGPRRYIIYYMVTGIGAGILQSLVVFIQVKRLSAGLPFEGVYDVYENGMRILLEHKNYLDPSLAKFNLLYNSFAIGASGAVFGLLLAFGMFFPNAPLYFIFIPIPIKAKYMVIGYGLLEFFMGIANQTGDRIGHFAHLGGMLFGFFMILYWKKKRPGYDNIYF